MTAWRPTIAHLRSSLAAVVMVVIAVVWRRPDVLVLAMPFAIVAGWSVVARPPLVPVVRHELANSTVREGDVTLWRCQFDDVDGVDIVTAAVSPRQWLVTTPVGGVTTSTVGDGSTMLSFTLRATRWGRHSFGPVSVAVTSAWASFRSVHQSPQYLLTSVPAAVTFDAASSLRPANGLVGLNRSTRQGDGSEFASVRPFQVGDRMRRIRWSSSLRSGTLQVTSTWAEQDSLVALIVDATADLGQSEGVDGRASSLDTTVRAAAAIAEHYLHRGDRVSLRVFGSTGSQHVAPAAGRAQLRRILDTLASIRPGGDPLGLVARGRTAMPADALAILLSPVVSPVALQQAVALARRGVTVAVVETLPADVIDTGDSLTALAWRIRLLERRREIRTVQEIGIPVVHWRGPGSLDPFLRDVARRASAPRMARR